MGIENKSPFARIRLFGEFRNRVPSGELNVHFGERKTVADLKDGIKEEFLSLVSAEKKNQTMEELTSLMGVSVLAVETRILRDSEVLDELESASFALLPPVCGG